MTSPVWRHNMRCLLIAIGMPAAALIIVYALVEVK